LNGRNFTQLLTITPGVVNLNTDQSSGGGGGWNGASIGSFSFPRTHELDVRAAKRVSMSRAATLSWLRRAAVA